MPPETPVTLCIPGLRQSLHMALHDERDQYISRRILAEGIWEPYETSLVMASLPAGGVFVDVGANIGYFSVLAASQVGDSGRVVAFEPDPDNFSLLRANIALNGFEHLVVPEQAALADADREGQLYLSDDNLGDHQIYATGDDRSGISIRLLDGSRYLRRQLAAIDLIKIDTQGSESLVIAGLLPLLRELPETPRLLVELTPRSLREAGSSGRELIQLLTTLNQAFWIVDHVEHRLVPSSARELAGWCDDVDAVAEDRGFMNIWVGSAPDSCH